MKKILLIAAWLLSAVQMNAAEDKGVMYLNSPINYQVLSVSENGQWACGIYSDDSGTECGFRWNLQTNKIETFDVDTYAACVANDGTVAGSYKTTAVTGSAIDVPAIYKNGRWNMLELPNKLGGWAAAITPDGHYVGGTDNAYASYIWKDGKIHQSPKVRPIAEEANGIFVTYCISPDGSKLGGWSYYSDDNRNPGYWDSSDRFFHELNSGVQGSPWQAVKKFTADGKKALYYSSYSVDPNNQDKGYGIKAIYDLETKTSEMIYPIFDDPFNFDFFDIGGNGSVLGYIQTTDGAEYGTISINGKTQYIEDYLKTKGADFSGLNMAEDGAGHLFIIRSLATSNDEKTMALLYYDTSYDYHTLIVALDKNLGMTPPVQLETKQMSGLMVVELTWSEPLGNKQTLKGYNVYRNGVKVNNEIVTGCKYYDKGLTAGRYTYQVSAVYDEGESEKSESVAAELSVKGPSAPTNLMARQKGYNSAIALWSQPYTNYIESKYYGDGSTQMDGFGGGEFSFESAILFPAQQVSLYAGYRVVGVSFYPLSEQGSWVVNLYRHNGKLLTLLKSIPVTQDLVYGEKNIVMLPQALTLQSGQDLLVGIQTNVTEESYNVQSVFEGCCEPGYTDLIRIVGETDFYSINQASQSGAYDMAWGTAALLAPADATSNLDAIDHYNIYVDGTKKTETKELSYEDNSLAAGSHTIGIQTAYADGRLSEATNASFNLSANENVLRITPDLTFSNKKMIASWNAPTDNDPHTLGYCNNTPSSKSPNATESVTKINARIDFTSAELKSYEGYQFESLSFYPMSNSGFELEIYEDGNPVAVVPVDDIILEKWNTVKLETPIEIKKGKTYSYCVVCYDCPTNLPPLAIDNVTAKHDYSMLIQSADEEDWYLITEETGCDGNWMMRAIIVAPTGAAMPVSGYDVYVDGEQKASQQQGTTYTQEFETIDDTQHTIRVDANYTALQKKVEGNTRRFWLKTPATGISDVKKGIGKLNTYNLAGQKVNGGYKGLVITKGKKEIKK